MAVRPQLESIWRASNQSFDHQTREELRYSGSEFDIAIVGAGITGLTCAYHLSKAGKKVAVLEAGTIGCGTTGYTSAHLSTSWDGEYRTISKKISPSTAELIARAMTKSIDQIEEFSQKAGLKNSFARVPGYLYDETGEHEGELQAEYDASAKAGLPVEWLNSCPLPFATNKSMLIKNQAIFQPMDHLEFLAQQIEARGGKIYECTRVTDFNSRKPFDVVCSTNGSVRRDCTLKAQEMVFATHTPLGVNLLHTVATPMRSYVAAVKLPEPFAPGLFWDMAEPYHYLRPFEHDGTHYVIVGGKDRKTGHGDERSSFAALRAYIESHFAYGEIQREWSGQFYEPADHLPLIGHSPVASDIHLATGLSGDGLTMGTFAGWELSEQLLGRKTDWTDTFSPQRLLKTGYKDFVSENLDVAKCMVTGRLSVENDQAIETLAPGEGIIVGPKHSPRAVYKTEGGVLKEMSAVCRHLGCIVEWNPAQKSFDCPCHGARYSCEGDVLEGPALLGLKKKKNSRERNLDNAIT